jgi:large subunit ribosomal protein L10
MATPKNKKQLILDNIASDIKVQKSVVFLTTLGAETSLNAENNSNLRKEARKAGIKISVIKNTLLTKSFADMPQMGGQTYIAYQVESKNGDEITTPKAIIGLLKEDYKDYFNIVGCVLDGQFIDAAQTVVLSDTPSHRDSMAVIAGTLQTITSRIALGIKEIPASIARATGEVHKQK